MESWWKPSPVSTRAFATWYRTSENLIEKRFVETSEEFILVPLMGWSSRRDETILQVQNFQKLDDLYQKCIFHITLNVDADCSLEVYEIFLANGQMLR